MFTELATSKDLTKASLEMVVQSYVRYFAAGASHTARAKRLDLAHFLKFLTNYRSVSKSEKLKVADWDFSSVQRFVDQALARGEAAATVARRLATIKHMGRSLAEKIPGFINPAREVRGPKIKPIFPKALSTKEIANAKASAKQRLGQRDSFIRARNQMLLEFLLDTGLRAEEVRLLKLGQLDERYEWIANVRTKGRRFRNVYVTSAIRDKLGAYLKLREHHLRKRFGKVTVAQNRNLPLFISTYRAALAKPESLQMGPKSVWRAINELSAGTPLHPHLLRHSYAIDLLDSSSDIRLVAQALGHSDVRVTMRYTERKESEIAKALEKSRRK